MTGLLLQIGATKLAVSVVLAGVVWVVHRRVDRPSVSYPLWLLVLVTLLVPAVVSLPVLPAESTVTATAPAASAVGAPAVVSAAVRADPAAGPEFGASLQPGLAILWFVGTAGLLGWTVVRTIRFRRTLTSVLRPAPAGLRREAAGIGCDLGMVRIPEVHIVCARVTPMVWWTGGTARVLIPAFLLTDLSREELHAILAHELAHVRRRDHLVRWLEWLACSVFWWNPVAWWARHHLQIAEESCCDQLAVGAVRSCPRIYAKALLRVVASTSQPPRFRPPLPVSAAGGVGRTNALERRIRMIVSTDSRRRAPRWLRTVTWVAMLCALPFGLIYCDWQTAVDEETAMDPVEDAAPAGIDELRAAAERATQAISRREAELQEIIREAMESGALSDRRGRELSAYLSGAASGSLSRYAIDNAIPDEIWQATSELLIAEMGERTRGLWTGDYTSRISTTDLQSPELRATLAELRELVEEIGRDPDAGKRLQELSTMLREALGHVLESQGRK